MPPRFRSFRRLFPGLLALAFAAGPATCPRQETPGPAVPRDIRGTWDWVRSVERVGGEVHSPGTTGFTAELVISGDPTSGGFEYRRNGTAAVSGRFGTGWEDEAGNDFVNWDPPFPFHHEMQWLAAGTELMRLEDAAPAGYVTTWARRR